MCDGDTSTVRSDTEWLEWIGRVSPFHRDRCSEYFACMPGKTWEEELVTVFRAYDFDTFLHEDYHYIVEEFQLANELQEKLATLWREGQKVKKPRVPHLYRHKVDNRCHAETKVGRCRRRESNNPVDQRRGFCWQHQKENTEEKGEVNMATPEQIQKAVETFLPVMYLESTDPYRPLNFDAYVAEAALKNSKTGVVVAGQLSGTQFTDLLFDQPQLCNEEYSLFLPQGMASSCIKDWNPTAEELKEVPLYVHTWQPSNDLLYVSYTHLYAYNGPTHVMGVDVGAHYADLEHTTVEVTLTPAGEMNLNRMYFSKHNGGNWVSSPFVLRQGTRPVVFSAKCSHASYEYPQVCSRFYGVVADVAGPGLLWDVQQTVLLPDDPALAPRNTGWMSVFQGSLGDGAVTSFRGKSWWNALDVAASWSETYPVPTH